MAQEHPKLFDLASLVPGIETPEFHGITFHETRAKTMLNRMRGARPGGIAWTFNPYRGCSHACTYCFAREGHARLGQDIGAGFSSQIFVKTNAAQVLRSELRRGKAGGDWVMMGTVTDCYQRAEGRYRLMPDILRALADYRISFTTATKSALLGRDTELFAAAAERAEVLVMVSLGSLDERVWRAFEPAASPPMARLNLVRTLRAAGVPTGVLIAPIIPHAADRSGALEALVDACAEAGAVTVYPDVMRIGPRLRSWFLEQTGQSTPERLHQRLLADYGDRGSMPTGYVRAVTSRVHARATTNGLPTWEQYISARTL